MRSDKQLYYGCAEYAGGYGRYALSTSTKVRSVEIVLYAVGAADDALCAEVPEVVLNVLQVALKVLEVVLKVLEAVLDVLDALEVLEVCAVYCSVRWRFWRWWRCRR